MSVCVCVFVCVSKIVTSSPGHVDQQMITSQKRTLTSLHFCTFEPWKKIGGSRRQSYKDNLVLENTNVENGGKYLEAIL